MSAEPPVSRVYFTTPAEKFAWEEGFWVDRAEMRWPISMEERARLALYHEPEASASPDGYRLATCVVPTCKRPMVAMWHLWMDWTEPVARAGDIDISGSPIYSDDPRCALNTRIVKEIHMCHACATDIYGAPTVAVPGDMWDALEDERA